MCIRDSHPGYKTTQPETLASRDVPRLQFHGDRERLFNELHTRPFRCWSKVHESRN